MDSGAHIEVSDPAQGYVSRAALKLEHALVRFSMEVAGKTAIDLGASTGGFTQVLLEHGAAHVYAVDVGHGQLVASLVQDPRVTAFEGVNARNLTPELIGSAVDLVVCDVSFISLKLALPPALDLVRPGGSLIALIKPQFEAGREALGKGGIVRDGNVLEIVCEDIRTWLENVQGWQVAGIIPSPVAGADGNVEFLISARKT